MDQQPPATLAAVQALTSAELINHLVVAVDEQDVRFVCFWLQRMHEKGMLYARNGKNGVDKPDVYGRSAITAVATAEFSHLRQLILQLLLLNLDGDPAQTSVFHEYVGELQEWACMMLHGWVSSGRREAGAAQALLWLDDSRRAAWIAENLPPSPCPILTGIRFLAPRSVQLIPRRPSPRPHTFNESTSARHLPLPPRSSSTSFGPSNSSQSLLPQRSLSDPAPPPFLSTSAPLVETVSTISSRSSQKADRLARRKTDTPPEEGELLDPIDLDKGGGGRSFHYSTAAEEVQCDKRGREKDLAGGSDGEKEEGEVEQAEEAARSASTASFVVAQAEEGDQGGLGEEGSARTSQVDTASPPSSPPPQLAQLVADLTALVGVPPHSPVTPSNTLHAATPQRPSTFNPLLHATSALPAPTLGGARLNSSPYPSPEPSPPPASHPSKLARSRKLSSPPPPAVPLSPILPRSATLLPTTTATNDSETFNPFAGIFGRPRAVSPALPPAAPAQPTFPPRPHPPSRASSITSTFNSVSAPLRSSLKRRAVTIGDFQHADRDYKKRRQVRWPANERMIAVVVGEGAGWDKGQEWEGDGGVEVEGDGGGGGVGGKGERGRG